MRQRAFVLTAIVAVAALVVGGGVWAWRAQSSSNTTKRRAARSAPVASTTTSRDDRPHCRSHLTPDAPLRLWIGGDSLAGSLGPALGDRAARTGVVLPTFDSRPSSGLTSASFFDWPKHAASEMFRFDPEIVVFIIGANDFSFVSSRPVDRDGKPVWRGYYATLVQQMLNLLRVNNRPIYWIGSPPLSDAGKDAGVRQINEVARAVVGLNADAVYIDAYKLFAGIDGKFTPTLPGPDGKPVRVRTSDGIHFTPAGADLLAAEVFSHLDGRCRINQQAVPNHRQPVREAPGSSLLPPSATGTPHGTTATTRPPPPPPPPPPPSTTTPTSAVTLPTVP
jgi:hypothetical protein